jgi:hypothetical protein
MEVFLNLIMYWCLAQFKTSDSTYLFMEVIDSRCIDFGSPKYYGSIMARKYRCLMERLDVEVDGSIRDVHISNIKILLPILFHITNCKLYKF